MSQEQPRYPIGVQSFEKLRRDGCVYVDKTMYIPQLLRNSFYFLSRPRRFGKSLLLSTLEAYFRGKKELFEGLAVYDWEKDWTEYPVVHIDFSSFTAADVATQLNSLSRMLLDIAESYGLREGLEADLGDMCGDVSYIFGRLIFMLHKRYGRQVVILIDEYDKVLLEHMPDEERIEEATNAMRPFFNVLKSSDQYIKFAFVTGVSRFRNTTLFSGANNLTDISMIGEYASLLGISQEEIGKYFTVGVDSIAQKYGWSRERALAELRDRYDGYRFTCREEYLYNPFSLLGAFRYCEMQDYWVQSGSSKMLADHLRGSLFKLEEMTTRWVSGTSLGATFAKKDPTSLLFQTGYLTVRDYRNGYYRLGIPNQEVQTAIAELVIPEFVRGLDYSDLDSCRFKLGDAIANGNIDEMMETLRSMLVGVPYHIIDKMQEKHLHLCTYLIFLMMGVSARCETASASGRVDMVAQTPKYVYVFEFKLDGDPEEALRQIDDRGYAIPWESDGRVVFKIGVDFSSSQRTIRSWHYRRQ